MRRISYQGSMEEGVQVAGRNLPISRKIGREIAVFIKGKNVNRAIKELKLAAEGKLAIPYKRHNAEMPHRKGKIMCGKFPVRASLEVVKLLESLKSNAENKAFDADSLKLVHVACQHGTKAWHYGRKRRRLRKLAHFELVGVEVEEEEKKYKQASKPEKKEKKIVEKPKVEKKPEPEKKEKKAVPKKEVKKPARKAPKKEVKKK